MCYANVNETRTSAGKWNPPTTFDHLYINLLAYADDLVLLAPTMTEAQQKLSYLVDGCNAYGLQVSTDKTEWIHLGASDEEDPTLHPDTSLSIGTIPIKKVHLFRYLGLHLTRHDHHDNILHERAKAGWRGSHRLKHLFLDRRISTGLRTRLAHCLVFACFMYGMETLTLRGKAMATIQRFEDIIYSMTLNTKRAKYHSLNPNRERVLKFLKQEERLWLTQQARLRRLSFIGHVERGNSICKDILHSTAVTKTTGCQTTYLKQVCKDIQHFMIFHNRRGIPFARVASDRNTFRRQ